MKKILAVVLAVLMAAAVFASCAGNSGSSSSSAVSSSMPVYTEPSTSDSVQPIVVHLKVTDVAGGNTVVADTDVQVIAANPTAANATTAAFDALGIAYGKNPSGMYDYFGGRSSSTDEGWILYINGNIGDLGADDQPIANGDVLEWKYISYAVAFPDMNS